MKKHILTWLFITVTVLQTHSAVCPAEEAKPGISGHALPGPDGTIKAIVTVNEKNGRLTYSITRQGNQVIEDSALGVTVNGEDLGLGVSLGKPKSQNINETYAHLGVKAERKNNCIAYSLPVTLKNGTQWTLEVRVFDDGVALRYRIPGEGRRRVTGEATSWRLPKDAPLWIQHNTANYEGDYYGTTLEKLHGQTDNKQKYVGPPATVELPGDGYALITEGCLYRYSGMTLKADTAETLKAVFQDDPDGWDHDGEIVSPWRVTVIAKDLCALVNTDLINSLGEAPDPQLFPKGAKTEWIKPGKGVCTWAVFKNDGAQWHRQKWFIDTTSAMGCEYLLLDGGWRSKRWGFLRDGGDQWARLKELCEYAAARKMGIFVWNAYPEGRNDGPGLTDPVKRKAFFRKCKETGVVGVKIDFFDTERKKIIDVYEDILKETAEEGLMLNLHGTHKPTGETRTWPHEVTREGLREQEYLLWDQLPHAHYGTLPFTRMVAGHGDFLPGFVRDRYLKNTTAVFQLATTVVFTSPLLCWPDRPEA